MLVFTLLLPSFALASDCAGCLVSETLATGFVGINSSAPITALDLSQTNSALALPIGNSAARPTGSNVINGEIRYNTSLPGLEAYVSGAWSPLASGTASQWVNGTGGAIYYNGGNVGIGTTSPTYMLDVRGSIRGFGITMGNNPSNFQAYPLGISQGERSGYTFWSTFQNTSSDNGPRRTADMLAGFNGGNWGNEYLAFNVGYNGSANDAANLTLERMRIAGNGNIGIGTTSPVSTLDISGNNTGGNGPFLTLQQYAGNNAQTFGPAMILNNHVSGTHPFIIDEDQTTTSNFNIADPISPYTAYLTIAQSGNIGIETASPSYTLQVNGSVAGTSAYNNTSDARLKKNVQPITYGLDTVMRLRPISFDWISQDQEWKKKHQLGLIAQEVEPIVPEVVTIADDKMRTRSLAYGEMVPVLIKAIQDLKATNDDEAAEIDALKARVEVLEAEKR